MEFYHAPLSRSLLIDRFVLVDVLETKTIDQCRKDEQAATNRHANEKSCWKEEKNVLRKIK